MDYQIYYYNPQLKAEIEAWPKGILACYYRILLKMECYGANLGMPYTKAMGEGLFEIRATGTEGIGRAFFCTLKDQKIVILHSFIKKSQKTPIKEMNVARNRLKEVKNGQ